MEVQLLYESWKSGATSFRRLADGEWKTWLERDFEGRMDDMENGGEDAANSVEETAAANNGETANTGEEAAAGCGPATGATAEEHGAYV